MPNPAAILLLVVAAYAVVGIVFGVAFVAKGARVLDPAASATPLRVRALFLPGAVAMWPALLIKWARANRDEGSR